MYNPKQTGFFPLIQLKIEESLSQTEKSEYLKLPSLEDKIQWLNKLPRVSSDHQDNILKAIVKPNHGVKSKEKSVQNREAGNSQFYAANFKQAQILYSMAVFSAPAPSKESNDLALAFANRSACYQKMGGPRLALRDIELALSSGYPEDKAFKLVERRGECQASVGETSKALDSFQMAIKMIKKNAGLKQREKFIAAIEKKIEKVTEQQEKITQNNLPNASAEEDEIRNQLNTFTNETGEEIGIDDRHEILESAHAAVEIRYAQGRGRYAVASRDIEIGTTLFREQPLTCTLHPDRFGTNCQHCFQPIKGVVPCLQCTWVCFCSSSCRSQAAASYHQYECGIIKLLLESGLNVYAYLALRCVTKEGLHNLLKIKEDLKHPDEKSGTTADSHRKFYSSKDFRNAYNLVAHEDSIEDDMWLLRGLVAIFLLKCLQTTHFFHDSINNNENEDKVDRQLTQDEAYVGGLLFRLLNVMPTNTHDISEFETPILDSFAPGCVKVSVGAGLYPCLALLNHGCEPSFMRCNKGNVVICVASKTIKKGQEICENYGLMYTAKELKERQKILLDHYKFSCACGPCTENWPSLLSMKEELKADSDKRLARFLGIKCTHCGATVKRKSNTMEPFSPVRTCVVCGESTHLWQDIPLEAIKKLSSQACEALVKGQWQQGLALARQTESKVLRHFSLPVLELSEVQIAIWKCMWLVHGSMRLVKML